MNNAGSIEDIWAVLLVVITLAVVVPIGWTVVDSFQGQLEEMDSETTPGNVSQAAEVAGGGGKDVFTTMDALIGFLFVGVGLVAVAFAVYLPSHSVYALFSWFIILFQGFLAIVFENFYAALMSTEQMADAGAVMTVSGVIMENMLELTIVFGALVVVAQYATGGSRGVPR